MTDTRKVKNRVIFTLLVVILIMVTAIVVLAHNNNYGWKPDISSPKWDVEFTSIAEVERTGGAIPKKRPSYSSTRASFFVNLYLPGDSITYELQVSNLGNLDAELENIVYITSPNKDVIRYELIGIREGDELEAGETKNFKIKISYVLDSNEAAKYNKPISIVLEYRQDD